MATFVDPLWHCNHDKHQMNEFERRLGDLEMAVKKHWWQDPEAFAHAVTNDVHNNNAEELKRKGKLIADGEVKPGIFIKAVDEYLDSGKTTKFFNEIVISSDDFAEKDWAFIGEFREVLKKVMDAKLDLLWRQLSEAHSRFLTGEIPIATLRSSVYHAELKLKGDYPMVYIDETELPPTDKAHDTLLLMFESYKDFGMKDAWNALRITFLSWRIDMLHSSKVGGPLLPRLKAILADFPLPGANPVLPTQSKDPVFTTWLDRTTDDIWVFNEDEGMRAKFTRDEFETAQVGFELTLEDIVGRLPANTWYSEELVPNKNLESLFSAEKPELINVEENKQNLTDAVNHPAHYTQYTGVEVIDITEKLSFNRGNAVKYICRAGFKSENTELKDLQKALWYTERALSLDLEYDFPTKIDTRGIQTLVEQMNYNRGTAVWLLSKAGRLGGKSELKKDLTEAKHAIISEIERITRYESS